MGYSNGICNLCSNNIETLHRLWRACIEKIKVFVPNEQLSLTYTLLVMGSVNSKHKTSINMFLFETKFMISKCRNCVLEKSHTYLDAFCCKIILFD